MEIESAITERRWHPRRRRVPGNFRAILSTRNSIANYVIRDLSAGGALVVGVPLSVGTLIELVLGSHAQEPVRVLGRVVRSFGSSSGVAFLHRGDDAEDAIQSLVLKRLEQVARRD